VRSTSTTSRSELLDAPEAVRIESRPGRAKLLYRLAKPLPSFRLGSLELRCASSTGVTVQDVLPPSIHPDTGKPYSWRYNKPDGHWSRLPPLPGQLLNLWQGLVGTVGAQTQKPKAPKAAGMQAPRLRVLLEDKDPDAGYDEWIAVGMALHHETGGNQTGLMLWNEWSAAGKKYQGLGDLEQHWRSFRLDHDNPKTLASLRKDTPASADEFEDVPADAPHPSAALPAPPAAVQANPAQARVAPLAQPVSGSARERAIESLRAVRRSKMGTIEARISNIVAVLGVPEVAGVDLALDEFQDAIMVTPRGGQDWRPLTDTDYTQMRVWLETTGNCDPIPHEMVRQAAHLVAEQHKLDTARRWLEGLKWDGTNRIEFFCPRYFGTANTEYERAVGRYLWTALAGRVMAPGCQADMVPVLIGRQGIGKSRGVQAMVPSPEHYVEVRLDENDDAIARKLRGVLVGEMAEMRGLRAADVERVKAFITRSHEKWVPKYKEFATSYPRRCIIVGTTNDEEFLPQDTEHRRWLPLHSGRVDVERLRNDRDQLWAEALVQWEVSGIAWQGLDVLAAPARADAAGADAWEEQVAEYVFANPAAPVKLQDVMTNAIGLDPRTTNRSHELRVGRILRSLGYSRLSVREGSGKFSKVWVLGPES
jgi:Virulence-associated protein E/Primase C terminal 2 (PriCT-2)